MKKLDKAEYEGMYSCHALQRRCEVLPKCLPVTCDSTNSMVKRRRVMDPHGKSKRRGRNLYHLVRHQVPTCPREPVIDEGRCDAHAVLSAVSAPCCRISASTALSRCAAETFLLAKVRWVQSNIVGSSYERRQRNHCGCR